MHKINDILKNDGVYMFEWDLDSKSNPQLAYKIEIIDLTNNSLIYTIEQTRPEINKLIYTNKLNGKYNIELTITDIFGNVEKQNKILNTFEENNNNTYIVVAIVIVCTCSILLVYLIKKFKNKNF